MGETITDTALHRAAGTKEAKASANVLTVVLSYSFTDLSVCSTSHLAVTEIQPDCSLKFVQPSMMQVRPNDLRSGGFIVMLTWDIEMLAWEMPVNSL